MRTEIVTLCLNQVGSRIERAQAVEITQGRTHGRQGYATQGAFCNHLTPRRQSDLYLGAEEVVEQQVLQLRILPVRIRNLLQEYGTDNTAFTPYLCNRAEVQVPSVTFGSAANQRKTLCIRNQLRSIQGLANLFNIQVLTQFDRFGIQSGSLFAFRRQGRQHTGINSFRNQCQRIVFVHCCDGAPFAGSFLSGDIQDFVQQRFAVFVAEAEDILCNLNQKTVQFPFVPFFKDDSHFVVIQSFTVLQQRIGFGD